MTKKEGSKLYLVRWHSDGHQAITDGYQIEAIRHSEKKHYNGEPQMTIIREATAEDIAQETIKIRMTQNVRPDFPFGAIGGVKPGTILRAGQEYAAASNRHGAISGICENGEQLGVRPGEFEFVEAPDWILSIWRRTGHVNV